MFDWNEKKNLIDEVKDLIARVENAKGFDGSEGRWITVKGTHVFIPDGRDEGEVIAETFGKKGESKEDSKADKFKDLGFERGEQDRWHLKKDGEIHTIVQTTPDKYRYTVDKWDEEKGDGGSIFDKTSLTEDKLKEEIAKHTSETKGGKKLEDNIEETQDEHGRTVISYKGTNKKVKIHKNGDYFLASFGQELKDDDGYTEFQLFPGASGKDFKTEKGAKKWAIKQLKEHIENSLEEQFADTVIEALAEVIIEQ